MVGRWLFLAKKKKNFKFFFLLCEVEAIKLTSLKI